MAQRERSDQYERTSLKLSAVPGMVLTLVLSLVLFVANRRGSSFTGSGVNLVADNRDTVALIVQVISMSVFLS